MLPLMLATITIGGDRQKKEGEGINCDFIKKNRVE